MKKFILFILLFNIFTYAVCQSIKVESKYPKNSAIILAEGATSGKMSNYTVIGINLGDLMWNSWVSFSSNIVLQYIDPKYNNMVEVPIERIISMTVSEDYGDYRDVPFDYKIDLKWLIANKATANFVLMFPMIPVGITKVNVIEKPIGKRSFKWLGITINPRRKEPKVPFIGNKGYVEELISKSSNPYSGLYEEITEGSNGYHLAFVSKNDSSYLIYMGSDYEVGSWKIGEVKAVLRGSALNSLYKADWYLADKTKRSAIISFDNGLLRAKIEDVDDEVVFIPMGETYKNRGTTSSPSSQWSGTGFALNRGYIVTNYHVVGESSNIEVLGIDGDFSKSFKAKIIGFDKVNDLALIKVDESNFKDFGSIPYSIDFKMAEVGEEVFVLGYPLTATMGEEVKLTNGIISSRTGFDGDVALYQMTAPIQPGNSGGPMFDSQGNLVGIICAYHKGAENAGYAIKTSYLRNLVESVADDNLFPAYNKIKNLSLKDKVKSVRNYVFLIKCSSK